MHCRCVERWIVFQHIEQDLIEPTSARLWGNRCISVRQGFETTRHVTGGIESFVERPLNLTGLCCGKALQAFLRQVARQFRHTLCDDRLTVLRCYEAIGQQSTHGRENTEGG